MAIALNANDKSTFHENFRRFFAKMVSNFTHFSDLLNLADVLPIDLFST